MIRKILILSLLIFPLCSNAAFYINMKRENRITIDNNVTKAVFVGAEGNVLRYKKKAGGVNEIDDGGRPYNAVVFVNEKCELSSPCKEYELLIKFYNDKKAGAEVIFFDTKKNDSIYREYVENKNLTMD